MKRGAVVAIAAGAVAVVALTAGGIWWASTRPPSAADAVRGYFAALESGDAEAALGFTQVDDTIRDAAAAAYSGAEARVSGAVIGDAAEDDDAARVEVTYSLEGESHATTLLLENDDGWTIEDGLGTLTASTTLGDTVVIGDLSTRADEPVALLPAVYAVAGAPPGIVEGSAVAAVRLGETTAVAVTAELSADAGALAQAQLDAYADACTQPAAAIPDHCGLRVPWAADLATLTSITFRVEERPVLELAAERGSFAATGGVVVATATGTTRDGEEAAFTYRADDWALRGTIDFIDGQLVLKVG